MNRMEAEFSNLVKSYRKKHMGKGPERVTTTFCKCWAICEMEGNLSPVEKFMAKTGDGRQMLRTTRTQMVKELYKDFPPVEMEELLGAKFVHLFVDIDIERDIGMSVFVFDEDVEKKFAK
ncbi:DUF2294 domain-containing protein [Paenibacillus roseipurpureus]|uniref:DUF2294 domain-containing protein n=1 Tax=Paenibacillus roseopurpureus TaxID=2918901 RepID=A0AA96RKK0_9BACL|nr:DUF2294 domain-containing protein [Paenibacillus sp. MBLB1832]WNR44434.1 DUF2294 domain-containing protein [Paenibacillus sp. MBLB1832]